MGLARRSIAALLAGLGGCADADAQAEAIPTEWDFDPACAVVDDRYRARITSVTFDGNVTIEGASIQSVKLLLVGRAGEGTAEITAPAGKFSARILPGHYDVYYEGGTGEGVPQNRHFLLRSALDLTNATTLAVAIPAVTIGGALRVDGELLAQPDDCQPAQLVLWGREGEASIEAAASDDFVAGAYEVTIIPGRYDVQYSHWTLEYCPSPISVRGPADPPAAPVIVNDHRGVVIKGLALSAPTALDLDIPLSRIDGYVTWADKSSIGGVELFGDDPRFAARYEAAEGEISGLVVDGRYDVYVNGKGPVLSDWVASGDAVLSVDVPFVDVHGRFEIGAGPVAGLDVDAEVTFEPPVVGSAFRRREDAHVTGDGSFSTRLPVGVYTMLLVGDATFEQTLARDLPIYAPLDYRLELAGARVETSITANGIDTLDIRPEVKAAFPGGEPLDGHTDWASEWVVRQLVDRATGGEAILPRGTYDILLEPHTPDDSPAWTDHRLAWLARGVDVTDGSVLDLVLPLRQIEVSASIDGDEVTADSHPDDSVGVHRRGDPSGTVGLLWGPTGGGGIWELSLPTIRGTGPRTVLPGTYDVYFDNDDATADIPMNRGAIIDCFNIR